MLQRAAKNAYSWWWASHIRTKQSKWLDQNNRDMEEKVDYILKIIDEDGDSFARRAEMYYRKRPELLNFVEDTFRSYRALAERYDHLSKDLQTANRTIATVCPERVQMLMYDEDGESFLSSAAPPVPPENQRANDLLPAAPNLSIPKILSLMKKTDKRPAKLMSKKGLLKFNADDDDANVNVIPSSGLRKEEALSEIDKLQKQILGVETEKEFVKSSYERQIAKYWEFEDQVAEMQAKVNRLQDEFGIGTSIEDGEARTLMTSTALKSCRETLVRLQEQNQQSNEAAKIERQKVQNLCLKFESLMEALKHKMPLNLKMDPKKELELDEKIKEDSQFSSITHLTMYELAENVDETVEKVISLEISASSQNAQIHRLKNAADEFLADLQRVEEEKETLIGDSESTRKKIRELEEEFQRVMSLDQTINDQSNFLQTHISEASCTLDDLSVKLINVQPDEDINDNSPSTFSEAMGIFEVNSESKFQEEQFGWDYPTSAKKEDQNIELSDQTDPLNDSASFNSPDVNFSDLLMDDPLRTTNYQETVLNSPSEAIESRKSVTFADSITAVLGGGETEKKPHIDDFPDQGKQEHSNSISDILGDEVTGENLKTGGHSDQENFQDSRTRAEGEEPGIEYDQPNWRELFLNSLDEREKVLLEEYITALRNYKESKKKLNEAENRRRASHFQYVIQIKVLKNSNALKDAEIQSLKKKLNSVQENHLETSQPNENITRSSSDAREVESLDTQMKSLLQLIDVPTSEDAQPIPTEETTISNTKGEDEGDYEIINVKEFQTFSTIEEKIRVDIYELMEENIELLLRFSTAFHQIGKFQKSVEDLQGELRKTRKKNTKDGGNKPQTSLLSEVRPIYKHMREIQTELVLWLEHTAVLKEDLKHRWSSLTNIQDEVTRLSNAGTKEEENMQLSAFQAGKFQGEILNMKEENKKVVHELETGIGIIHKLHALVTRTLKKLDEKLGIKEMTDTACSKIPVKSFLFGMKLKKQMPPDIFARVNPALMQKKVVNLPKQK